MLLCEEIISVSNLSHKERYIIKLLLEYHAQFPNIEYLYYLVLVCGVKLIPWLRVIGLVPAKHTNRYRQNWKVRLFWNLIFMNKALISDSTAACQCSFTSDLIPLRATLFHFHQAYKQSLLQRNDERPAKRQDSAPSCEPLLKALSCVCCHWSIIKGKSTVWIAAGGEEVQAGGGLRGKWKRAGSPVVSNNHKTNLSA